MHSLDQKLYPEVKAFLHRLAFVELATDQAQSESQFNALYVRRDRPAVIRFRVTAALSRARVRRVVGGLVGKLCPSCLRRRAAADRAHAAVRKAT